MTRIMEMQEGFEMGDLVFWTLPNSASINTTTFRSGARACNIANNTSSSKTLQFAYSEVYLRVGARWNNNVAWQIRWLSGATILGSVRLNGTSQRLELYTGTGTLVATGTLITSLNTWYLLEIHIKIDDTTGAIDLRIDGNSDASFAGDTKPGADASFDTLTFVCGNGVTLIIDDLAMNDTTGGADNSWCGDGKIVLLSPSAAGDSTQWTPSAGSNWQNVDDIPPDGDTTYNYANTSGYVDLYNTTTFALPANHVVKRVYVEARTREETAQADTLEIGIKTNGSEYWSSPLTQLTSYAAYKGTDYLLNPQTNAAWTQAELDALQVGVKIP